MDAKKTLILLLLLILVSTPALGAVSSFSYNSPTDGDAVNTGKDVVLEFDISAGAGTIYVRKDGVTERTISHPASTTTYTTNIGSFASPTSFGWNVEYDGDDGTSEQYSVQSIDVEDDAYFATIFENSPNDDEVISSDDVTFDYGVEADEPGSLEVGTETCSSNQLQYFNSVNVIGGTSSSESYTLDFEDCYGTFDWSPRYTGDDGSIEDTGVFKQFTVESDASQLTEFSNNNPNDNDNFDADINQEYTVDFEVSIGSPQDKGEVEFYVNDNLVGTDSSFCSSCSTTASISETLSDDNYDWYAKFVGVDGSTTTTSTDDFEIENYADRSDLSMSSPNDGATLSSDSVTFDYSNAGGGDGDVKLYVDGNLESTKSYTGSTSQGYSTTVSGLSDGSHTWYVEYEGDDGSSTSLSSDSFTVDTTSDAEETTLSNDNPADGASFIGTDTTISYDGSVAGNSGTVRIFSDTCSASGSQIYSTSYGGASTLTFGTDETWNCAGTFDWYIEYEGDDGSTKTTTSDSFTINSEASQTTLTLNNPSQGETIVDANGDVTFDVLKEGYDGTVELYIDGSGTPAYTWSLSCSSCSESLTHTETLSSGSHSYNARYVGSDGSSFTTSTRDFTVQSESDSDQTTLSLDSPTDGQTYNQDSVEYNYSVDGNSGSVEIYRNGTKIHTDSYSGSGSQSFSYSETLSNGDYEYYLKYVGDDGSTKSSNTRVFSVDAPLTSSISLDQPSDGKEFKSTFPINVDYQFQVSGESGTVELFRDSNIIKTFSHPKGQNLDYSFSESFSQEGNHSYYVKYTRDSDSQTKTSATREYSVVQEEVISLNLQSPSDGASFEFDQSVQFDYSASSNVIGTVELMLNGSSVKSNNYASPGETKSYSYEASDLSGGDYNSRVRFTSDDGNTHLSDYVNFTVEDRPVNYIDNIQVKYRGVDSGSVDKSILVNLTGNSSIDDYEPVSGDTAVFNDDKWVIENVSIPYQDDLVVYDTQNRNDTRSLDLDVSVKSLAGHPENANLSYQEKNRTLSVQNNGATFDFNYSCSSNAFGNPANVDGIGQVMAGSSNGFACRWSGDWLNHSSGQFDPTVSSIGIDELLPMDAWLQVNNSESVSFPSVKYPEIVPDPTCSTANPVSVGNNSEVNKTAEVECDVGDSGDPTLTIDGSDYTWNTSLNLSSDLTENISLTWSTDKSNLSKWSSRDAGSSIAYFKGISDDILLAESSSSVEIIVPDGTFSGGVGEGLHPARIEYTVGASSGGSGGTGGGGSGGTPRIIRNVTGTYNWSVSAPRSEGQTFYNIVGWGGRDLGNAPTRVVARNLGTGNFTLEARCVSEDNSCDFIEISDKNITLDELENDRQVVQVEGVIPQDMPSDGYRFNIVFEDPEGQEIETNFRINKNYAQSLIIRFISKVFGVREVDFDGEGGGRPVPIPLALPVFLITGVFWGALSLFIRFAQSNNMLQDGMDFTRGRLIAALLVFILSFIFI